MRSAALLGTAAALLLAAPAHALPVLGTETPRGTGTVTALPAQAPSPKTIDGQIGDWAGTSPGYGGVTVRSAGELVYTDHLFDAWGADDGEDAERLAQLQPVTDALPETYRLEAILRNDPAGQVGAPSPEQLQYLDHYGDLDRDTRADLTQLRLAPCEGGLCVLARTATMKTADDVQILLLLDTDPASPRGNRYVRFSSGLQSAKADFSVLITGRDVQIADLTRHTVTQAGEVAVNPDGWTNAVEARIPLPADVRGVAAAVRRPGKPFANVAFRHAEPVREWMEKQQALALLAKSIDGFFQPVDLPALRAGANERWVPGSGYHERIFTSTDQISREEGVEGILQHYGVYLPQSLVAGKPAPLQLWLHWRGGTAHSAGHTIPGMFRDLGEAHGTIVISPRGRGTSSWYVGRGQVDVEQVWADAHATYSIDPARRYVAGHSMGGWGSFLMTLIHPDWFAAALPASPPVTQGAWTGLDFEGCDELKYDDYSPCYIEANGGDPRRQHTLKLLENVRHVPWAIYHGLADELVPYSGVALQVRRLMELGYRHRFYTFPTQEHFGPPVWDEWKEGGDYMHRFTAPRNPARVDYLMYRSFEEAIERVNSGGAELDFDIDGAYWVDKVLPHDIEPEGRVSVTARSLAIPEKPTLAVPEAFGPTMIGNTGPWVMTGLQWLANPLGVTAPVANRFELQTNAARLELDLKRAGIDLTRRFTAKINGSYSFTLRLKGFDGPTPTVRELSCHLGPSTYEPQRSGDTLILHFHIGFGPCSSGAFELEFVPPSTTRLLRR